MPYKIDSKQAIIFNRYFADIEASTSEFQKAILPLLNVDWDKHNELFIAKLQSIADQLEKNVYRECILATKDYINSRDFIAPNKYETTSYFYDALQYNSESQALKDLNQKFDQLIQDIPGKNIYWQESFENLWLKTASTLFRAFDFAKEHPLSTITALLYGQVALASAFPAVLELSSLDGSNGFKINGEAEDDYSGTSVSRAGDINGDGIDDLIIGAYGAAPGGKIWAGSSYVIFGKNEAWTTPFNLSMLDGTNGFKINGEAKEDYSGRSVNSAGDINGDGIDDLIIGAFGTDHNGKNGAGSSYVIFGKTGAWITPFELSTLNGTNGFKINGEAGGDSSGGSVSFAGDINGDGIEDLIIGASSAGSIGYSAAGASYVIFGKTENWTTPFELSTLNGANGFKLNGEVAYDYSGISVSAAGDINGDGISDLIIGAYEADPGGNNSAGSSYVIFGKIGAWMTPLELSTINGTNGFKINGEVAVDYSGWSVSSAGDINEDGYDDLIIGAYGADPGGKSQAGSSYVIFGKNGSWSTPFGLSMLNGINGFKINGEAGDDHSGHSVSSAGDINGDGIDDFIIGAHRADPHDKAQAGSSYVIFGKKETWTTPLELSTLNGTNGFKINGEIAVDFSGWAVSNVGDINGDGVDDFIIGAYIADPHGKSNAGSSYVIFGVNLSPVLTGNSSSVDYVENDPAKIIDDTITVTDVDNWNLISGVVSIVNNFQAGDKLSFIDQNGITGVYNNTTGVLNLKGSSILNNYQVALRSITYHHLSDNPTVAPRNISFIVSDHCHNSIPFIRTINIIAVNDAPVLANDGGSFDYIENDLGTIIDSSISITDADNIDLTNATIAITNNFHYPEDILTFMDQNGISGVYNNATGVLTLTGSSSIAYYQIALCEVKYKNLENNPIADIRTITFMVNDGVENSNAVTRDINVIAVNDAPVLTNDGGSFNYTENDPETIIDSSISITDADSVDLTNATIAITNNFHYPEDILIFMDQNGISGIYNNATGILALTGSSSIANYQTALRDIAYKNLEDDPVADTRTIAFMVNDGVENSNAVTRDINVIAVDDAPVLTNSGGSFDYTENNPATIIDSSIVITDIDSNDLVSATIAIINNFHYLEDILIFSDKNGISGIYNNITGILTLTGSSSIANYQTALREIAYKNLVDNPVTDIRTITFIVNDGAENSNAITRDINIIPINDAPVLANSGGSFNYTENDPATVVDSGIVVKDVDNINFINATVAITNNFHYPEDVLIFIDQNGIGGLYNNVTGVLTLTGTSSIDNYQIALRNVTYINLSDHPMTDLRTVTFRVNDGVDNSNVITRDIHIISIQDIPVITLSAGSLNYTENSGAVAIDPALTIVDLDNANLTGGVVAIANNFDPDQDTLIFIDQNNIEGSYNDTTGILSLAGSSNITNYQTALRSVEYENLSEHPTNDPRNITFMVYNPDGASAIVSRNINIIAVNDLPILSSDNTENLNYTENSAPKIIDNAINIFDWDNLNLANATIAISNNFYVTQDILGFTNQKGIIGLYEGETGVLKLTGYSSIENYQTALRNVTYQNLFDHPSADVRTISFMVNDGHGNSNVLTRNINIIPVDDAPVITLSSAALNYTEGSGVVAIDPALTVTDVDNTNLIGGVVSITNNFDSEQDVLIFVDQNNIYGSYNDTTGVLSLIGSSSVTNYQTALRSIEYENLFDNPTTDPRTISFIVDDGVETSESATRQINIIPVNNAPVLTNNGLNLNYTENDPATIVDPSITVFDADSINLTGATVSITGNFDFMQDRLSFTNQNNIIGSYNSALGVLTLSGSSNVTNYQAALRGVKYNNLSEDPTTADRTVSFIVSDGEASSATITRVIHIIPVHDLPVITVSGSILSYTEKEPAKIIDSNINIVDLDSSDLYWATVSIANNLNSAQDILSFMNQNGITGFYSNETGVLTLTGTSSVINYQVALRDVRYENLADNPTTDPRSIAFVVNDGFVSSVPAVRNITIIPLDNTPSADDGGFFDFGNRLFNAILIAGASGLIGLLFLALRICLYRKATQSFEKLTSIGDISTTEQQKKFQTNIVRPIAQAIFDRIRITGCFGYISDNRMKDYLSAVTKLIVELQQQAINVDLDNMPPVSQSLLINEIAKQTENVLLPAQGCCTCGACCRCLSKLCSAQVSPEVMEAQVFTIAIAIKNALKRNNYDTFLSRQSVGSGSNQGQSKVYEAPIEMAVLGGGLFAKSGNAPLPTPVNQVAVEKPVFAGADAKYVPMEAPLLKSFNSNQAKDKVCAIDLVQSGIINAESPIDPSSRANLSSQPKSPAFFQGYDENKPRIIPVSKGLDEKQIKQNVFRV